MSQGNTWNPTTGTLTGLTMVNGYNAGFQALQSENSGSSAPANDISAAPVFGQRWMDTSVGGKGKMKLFDGTSWLTWGVMDTVDHIWQPQIGGGAASVPSAATVDLGAIDGSFIFVTGTASISSFGSSAAVGSMKMLQFANAATLVNSASLVLPTNANITTAVGDVALVWYAGGGAWGVVSYTRASGAALKASLSTIPFADGQFNGTLVASVAANALTIAVKTRAGADPTAGDPVIFAFRNNSLTGGDDTVVTLTSALSITVPSGATLGTVNGQANRIWVGVFNNAGTPVLGVYNSLNGNNILCWDETVAPSPAAIGAGSTSPQAWYAGSALTSKAFRVLGYVEAQQTTAGTWASAPTKIQLFGPGVKKPGDVVQSQVSSSGSVSISPQSAANVVKFAAGFGISPGGSTATVTFARGATTLISNSYPASGGGGGQNRFLSFVGHDIPNTTSSTTYTVSPGSASLGQGRVSADELQS